jgi:PiT family inorganic phosphate transporter
MAFLTDKLNLFFSLLLVATLAGFTLWGLEYVSYQQVVIFMLATLFGLFMAFNIGGNDVANSFGTSVGAGTLTIKQALLVAAIFEVSGAMIAGGAVTDTIRKGIVDLAPLTAGGAFDPMDFVFIMMSALLAAALWLLIATQRGWPVSTTHSIIGGIVGASITLAAIILGGDNALGLVQWNQIGLIVMSWVVSPLLGGLMSFILFGYIKRNVMSYNERAIVTLREITTRRKAIRENHRAHFAALDEHQQALETAAMARDAAYAQSVEMPNPDEYESDLYRELHQLEAERDDVNAHKALLNYVPVVAAGGSIIITAMLLFKGLKQIDLNLSSLENGMIILMMGAAVWMTVYILARGLRAVSLERSTFLMFSWMQVFTAAGFAFSHGSNDIANAIGPFAAVLDVLATGSISAKAPVPPAAMLSFGIAMVVGLWFIGKEVIRTVGTELTRMHPASGFTAELSAATVVLIASTFGIPVSSTHILVGAVLGIGVVNRATNWSLMKPIAAAWIITLPSAAIMAAVTLVVLRSIF